MNKIYNKHILRNSLIPIITFLGADIVSILGGAVITGRLSFHITVSVNYF